MTGNWELKAAPTEKAAPFTVLAGFINEQSDEPSINDYTTAALQADFQQLLWPNRQTFR